MDLNAHAAASHQMSALGTALWLYSRAIESAREGDSKRVDEYLRTAGTATTLYQALAGLWPNAAAAPRTVPDDHAHLSYHNAATDAAAPGWSGPRWRPADNDHAS